MRDVLTDQYFGTDFEVVWDVVFNKTTVPKEQLEEIISAPKERLQSESRGYVYPLLEALFRRLCSCRLVLMCQASHARMNAIYKSQNQSS